MQLIVLSGLSGSGKSVALKILEDSGFFCIDNLPAPFLPEICRSLHEQGQQQVAISVDVRSRDSLSVLPQELELLRQAGIDVRLLFLEASHDTLIKRFSETRRRHPLSDGQLTLSECIEGERELLADISLLGHRLDSSGLQANALRAWVKEFVAMDQSRLTLICESFGFKHGLPLDADFVFDVRCLPNPFYEEGLRQQTGQDPAVVAFLERQGSVHAMFAEVSGLVERWLPRFIDDNRHYLTVAVGCTGGQHRSVYLAERLGRYFDGRVQVLVRHRELPLA